MSPAVRAWAWARCTATSRRRRRWSRPWLRPATRRSARSRANRSSRTTRGRHSTTSCGAARGCIATIARSASFTQRVRTWCSAWRATRASCSASWLSSSHAARTPTWSARTSRPTTCPRSGAVSERRSSAHRRTLLGSAICRSCSTGFGLDSAPLPVFVVQKHAATSLHYDFRLEVDGVMRSWAVPKGPSLDPSARRLAMPVEDHPMSWNEFEGVIGPGYGAGTVIRWDEGSYRNTTDGAEMAEALDDGYARFVLEGSKLRGEWSLRRMDGDRGWLLVKRRDSFADPDRDVVADSPESVLSGLTIEEVAERG